MTVFDCLFDAAVFLETLEGPRSGVYAEGFIVARFEKRAFVHEAVYI